MGKFEKRGLDDKEIEFRRTAQNVFEQLKPLHKKLTYAMVLHVMRQGRKKEWAPEDMEKAMRQLLSLRKRRLNRRFKESVNASKTQQPAS